MDYTVELTIETRDALTAEVLEDVAEIGGAAGGTPGAFRLSTTLTVEASDVAGAVAAGAKRVLKVAPGIVIDARAATCDEFDARVALEVERGVLLGMAEVAEYLGITRGRASILSAKRSDFPAPVARLKSGPIYRKTDLSTFAQGWQRKAGRPKASTKVAADVRT
jgi:hypothetical protein